MLVAEHLAACILSEAGISSAKTQLLEAGGRYFLESSRFDRVGVHGRRGLVSLAVLDAAFFGKADTPWTAAAERLCNTAWISTGDADKLSLGKLILLLRLFRQFRDLQLLSDLNLGFRTQDIPVRFKNQFVIFDITINFTGNF